MLKEIKRNARKLVFKHYVLLVFVCFVAAFIGSEFVNSAVIVREGKFTDVDASLVSLFSPNNDTSSGTTLGIETVLDSVKTQQGNKIFETNKGIFSSVINTLFSGSLYTGIFQKVFAAVRSEQVTAIVFLIVMAVVTFFLYFFIQGTYIVISRRIFLEGRIYEKVPASRFTSLIKVKKWRNVAVTMFLMSLFKTFWMITIVGGFIKKYEYFLVPYIMAENPSIKPMEAIGLSKRMMKGNKWKCFLYDISFVGWDVLSYFTSGLSAIAFSNPYKVATFTEYYVEIRRQSKEKGVEGIDKLHDKYLYKLATMDQLNRMYGDVIEDIRANRVELPEKKGIKDFLNRYFGISLYGKEYNVAYEKDQICKMKMEKYKDVFARKIYPERLFVYERRTRNREKTSEKDRKSKRFSVGQLNYLRSYSLSTMLAIFFACSFIGWLYEVNIHLVRDGVFVNRGTMYGPWLPIYGWGCVLILTVLYNFRRHPAKQFFMTIVLCAVVEYVTSFVLEMLYGEKWWDYSGYFINLNGRICAEGLLVFGVGGLAISYIVAPIIDNFLKRFKIGTVVTVVSVLFAIFLVDQVYSFAHPNIGDGITSYSWVEKYENVENRYIIV